MYNVKMKHYRHGDVQCSVYSHIVLTGKREKESVRSADASCLDAEPEVIASDQEAAHLRSIQNSLKRAKQSIYDIARANSWDYFVTLTFSPDKVYRYDYADCSRKLSCWLNNARKIAGTEFKYLVVPELHKDGAYHFHGLFSGCDALGITFSGHYDRSGKPIYNIGSFSLGFTTATKVESQLAVTKYITKYTTKELMEHTKNRKKYWCSRNCDRPLVTLFLFPPEGKNLLRDELSEEALAYKHLEYEVNLEKRTVEYFETMGTTLALPD